jgi:hypothetical protein
MNEASLRRAETSYNEVIRLCRLRKENHLMADQNVTELQIRIDRKTGKFELEIKEDTETAALAASPTYRFLLSRSTAETLAHDILETLAQASSETDTWAIVNSLYGVWAARNDLSDDWLDDLRRESNDRLGDLDGSER